MTTTDAHSDVVPGWTRHETPALDRLAARTYLLALDPLAGLRAEAVDPIGVCACAVPFPARRLRGCATCGCRLPRQHPWRRRDV